MSRMKLKFIKKIQKNNKFYHKKKNCRFYGISMALMILILIIGTVYYLRLVNNRVTDGYKINDLKNKLNNLKDANQKLEVNVIELQKISRIGEEAINRLKMVRTTDVAYLSDDKGNMAMR